MLSTILSTDRGDKAAGLNPFLVVASAGTTDVGAIDPLPEIGSDRRNMVSGITSTRRTADSLFSRTRAAKSLEGIELADSVVIDPHKGLFLPYGLGVVLVRNVEDLKRSFSFEANYMQDAFTGIDEAVAGGNVARADKTLPRPTSLAAAKAAWHRTIPGVPGREALTRQILL